jgi:hypothetical protein
MLLTPPLDRRIQYLPVARSAARPMAFTPVPAVIPP